MFPAWLDELFPGERATLGARRAFACKACLRSWMAEVETNAEPLVRQMVGGYALVLTLENQSQVASWAAKTLTTLQALRNRELFSPALYEEVALGRRPPTGFRIALTGRPRDGNWPCRFSAIGSASARRDWDVEPTFPDSPIDHYRAELCVGHLVVRATARLSPTGHDFDRGNALDIWPARTPVRWPPQRSREQAPAAARIAA